MAKDPELEALKDLPKQWVIGFAWFAAILLLILGLFTLFAPLFNRADYNAFNNSPQHVNAVALRFADDCRQLAETPVQDTVARNGIEQDIYQNAATVDINAMQMPNGVRSCVNAAIAHVSDGSK